VTLEQIAHDLDAPDPETRRIATKRLASARGSDAAALLLRALGDDDWRVRKEAALVAPLIEPRAPVVDALVGALHDAVNIGLRNAAVEALVGVGQESVARVITELPRLDADGRKLAAEALGGLPDPRATHALAALLCDPDENVRAAAAEALGRAGASGAEARESATAALVRVLSCGEPFVILAALEALIKLEAEVQWSALAPLVNDTVLRRYALAAGAAGRTPEAICALAEAVGDASATIARDAMVALGDVLFDAPEDIAIECARAALHTSNERMARVRAWADDEDLRVRGAALMAMGLARRESDVPRLVNALAEDAIAERAEVALRMFGRDAVRPVITAGYHAAPAARGASISIVPTLALVSTRDVLAEVSDALRSPLADVVIGALRALAQAGGASEIARVAALADHPDPRVAEAALSTLSAIAERAPAAAGEARRRGATNAAVGCVLIGAAARAGRPLDDADVAFLRTALAQGAVAARCAALDALATLGGDAAADAASFALADEEREVVLAAARAMGRLGRPEPLERIAAGAEDPALLGAALRALGEADPERLLAAALPRVQSAQVALACAAVEALGSRRARRDAFSSILESGLFAALDHVDPDVVKLALTEIGASHAARPLARLGMALDHAAPEVRRLAAELLGQAGGAGAQTLLRSRLARERDAAVRAALTEALMVRPHASPVWEDD
jgi:HEAT repeat protein